MHNLFVIDGTTESHLKDATILTDTNVFFDAWKFKAEFADLLAKLTDFNCYFVTLKSVVIEFLGGTKSEEDLQSKIDFLEAIFAKKLGSSFLPLSQTFPTNDEFLQFSRQANKFSTTDFELYCALKKYQRSGLLLMTRNHTDFTQTLFARKGFITLLGTKEIHTHGLYAYK